MFSLRIDLRARFLRRDNPTNRTDQRIICILDAKVLVAYKTTWGRNPEDHSQYHDVTGVNK